MNCTPFILSKICQTILLFFGFSNYIELKTYADANATEFLDYLKNDVKNQVLSELSAIEGIEATYTSLITEIENAPAPAPAAKSSKSTEA
jgi:hypothetical protein